MIMREKKQVMNSFNRVFPWGLLLLTFSVLADQVTLKNGDRVTGDILKKDAGTLTIKSTYMGTIAIPWDQVSDIKSDKPLTIVLPTGPVQGTVSTADGTLHVQGRPQPVPLADVVAVRNADEEAAYEKLQHPGWGELWAGTAAVGLAGSAGNARTLTFTTGMKAARVTNTDKTSIYFNSINASAFANGVNSATAKAVRGGIAYDHNITSRLFVSAFNDYEYDRFQDLDLRFVLGGGLGFHAVKTERSQLDLLFGADYNRSTYSTPLTQNAAEFFGGNDYTLKLTGATSLVQSFRIFDDFQNTGMYRINFDVGATTKVSKWLNWNVALSDRYLHHPALGRKTNDFLYTTGLGITFAR
jgi:putative salt-induced outer membrane protein YdiY